MTDVMSKEKRSHVMSRIRGTNTSPELEIRRMLRKSGVTGYRIHCPDIPGHPDIVFLGKSVAVFIDGCFWHKCPRCYREPETRKEYWKSKIELNVARDRTNNERLSVLGWKVLRYWEHEIKDNALGIALKIKLELTNSGNKSSKL